VPPDTRPGKLRPVPQRTRSARTTAREIGPSGWVPFGASYVLIAGCESKESSYELQPSGTGSPQQGALTYFLGRQLASAGPGDTYRDVFEAVIPQVSANCSLQHPQLEGDGDRRLFGLERVEPMRFVPVQKRDGNEIVLGAGLAMGVSEGSTWAIHPPGTKLVADPASALATARITAARGVTSTADVVTETRPGAAAAGARAVEIAHDHGDLTLVVRMAPSGLADPDGVSLAAAIAGSKVLRPARQGERAAATVHLLPPRQRTEDHDPVPQVEELTAPAWAVVGKGGELILALCAAGGGAWPRLRANLEKRAHYQVAVTLQNPVSRLRDAVHFVLLRQDQDGQWAPAAADPGGLPVFTAGERLGFEITNLSPVPLYCYVLDFGLSGRIGPVYPPIGLDKPLRAGGSIRFGAGDRPAEWLRLEMPPEFPFLRSSPQADTPGKETLKLIATTRQTDFRALYQEGFRGVEVRRGRPTSLDRLLGMTAGAPTREVVQSSADEEEDWTTVVRSFSLRPLAGS
jgi:hypothetical protein